jgi:hypothetical protein
MWAQMKNAIAIVSMLLILGCQRTAEKKKAETPQKAPGETLAGMKQDLRRADVDTIVTPVPPFLESCAIGGLPGADGAVTGQETHFEVGKAIYVTMRVRESPAGLQASLKVYDAKKNLLTEEKRPMNGAKLVTFTMPPAQVKAGFYHLETYWGGNIACDYRVTVTK